MCPAGIIAQEIGEDYRYRWETLDCTRAVKALRANGILRKKVCYLTGNTPSRGQAEEELEEPVKPAENQERLGSRSLRKTEFQAGKDEIIETLNKVKV